MRYGVVWYKKSVRPNSFNWSNLGDPIQSYAMLELYKRMGISEEEIIKVDRYNAGSYDGEYVVLPFNCYNMIFNQYRHKFNSLPVSDKIIPVFVSFHLHSRYIDEKIINQLRMYEPIGCRDEETMLNLRRNGIRSFLSGCITATLPKREKEPTKKKVFLVDIPEGLKAYIPEEVLKYAEYTTHLPKVERSSDEVYLSDAEVEQYYLDGVKQLQRYRDEATLVVTSRLHAASPCMAMGIPVILVSENFDGRFSWIDKYLPLYTPDKYENINWNTSAVEYEVDKKKLLDMFIRQIQQTYEQNSMIYDSSSLYEERNKETYNKKLIESLKKLEKDINGPIKYALWGLRADTLNLYNVIQDNMPEWTLGAIIDENSTGEFEGIKINKSDIIDSLSKEIIYIIVPEAAHNFARDYLSRRNLKYILVRNKTELVME